MEDRESIPLMRTHNPHCPVLFEHEIRCTGRTTRSLFAAVKHAHLNPHYSVTFVVFNSYNIKEYYRQANNIWVQLENLNSKRTVNFPAELPGNFRVISFDSFQRVPYSETMIVFFDNIIFDIQMKMEAEILSDKW